MQPLKIKLKLAKETKGTFVYEMQTSAGQAMGSVYLPRLVMPATPPAELSMTIEAPAA